MSGNPGGPENIARRLQILAYIDTEVKRHGRSPRDRDIAEVLGIPGIGDIYYHLKCMKEDEWITWEETETGRCRTGSIRLAALGRKQLAEIPGFEFDPADPSDEEASSVRRPKPIHEVGSVILSARISSRKAVRTVNIPVLNLIAASFDTETHSSDFSLSAFDPESYLNISLEMLDHLKIDELYALLVRGDSMKEAGIQSGDYVILKSTPTAENGDMCAVWIDGKEATLKYFFTDGKQVRLEAANRDIPPRWIDSSHTVAIQGKVVLVVRLAKDIS